MVVEVLRVWVDLQIRLYNGGLLFQPRARKFPGRENESFLSTLTSNQGCQVQKNLKGQICP